MGVKRKISIRKIIQATLTLVLLGTCITAVLSATRLHKTRKVSEVDIRIENNKYGFVTERDVKETILKNGGFADDKMPVAKLDIEQIEQELINNAWVDDAEVYVDNKSRLHALVTQRVPTVRIFEKSGDSYYLDKNNDSLGLSDKYNYYTMVVTNVPDLKDDSASDRLKAEIRAVTDFIRKSDFWNAQVSQVIVMDDKRFEIVPVLGEHRIIIGDTTNLQKKFDNLFTFYNKVLNEIGWDQYQLLDVSYKGQLVASPAIDWKLPVDKTIQRINWVESILKEDAPRPIIAKATSAPSKEVPKVAEKLMVAEKTKAEEPKPESKQVDNVKLAKPIESVNKNMVSKPETKREKTQPEPKENESKKEDKQPKYIYNGN